ncbi:MAG: hypothetical protein ACLQVI_11410 [Polyangiaceae bacterium]
MKYELGRIIFEIPATFRDDTRYYYASPRDVESIQVTFLHQATTAEDALSAAADGLKELYGPLLVYMNPTRATRGDGATAPAMEGEVLYPGSSSSPQPHRYGVAALGPPRPPASLLYFGPRTDFVRAFQAVVARVTLADSVLPAATPSDARRCRARQFSLVIPKSWSSPSTYLFSAAHTDRVSIRVTRDEPEMPADAVSLVDEVSLSPSAGFRVLASEVTPHRPTGGWVGRWLVEHNVGTAAEVTSVRRACLPVRDGTVTVHGRSPASDTTLLDSTWATFLNQFHEVDSRHAG